MIYVCADDYGMSQASCERIESCLRGGALNKISVLPNGKIDNLRERFSNDSVILSLHINLVEGKPLSKPEKLSLLASEDGFFKNSFGGLLLLSILPKKRELERQIYLEIREQIKYWKSLFPSAETIACDSHQHVHMIPLIFKALMRAIKDENVKVDYLRYPSEPLLPYLLTPSLYFTYRPVNLLKQWVLKLFGSVNRGRLTKSGINTAYFMGILFSGNMRSERVDRVLVHYRRLAEKNKGNIELLFHPGYIEDESELLDSGKKGFCEFYLSDNRLEEQKSLMNMNLKS